MSIELDFIKQLTTTKGVKEEAELINKKQIKESFNNLMNSPFLFGKNRLDIEKLEDKIKITYAYLSLIICLEEYSEEYEIKKDELRNMAKQILESSNKFKENLREKNKLKCSYINPYRNLLVANGSSNLEILSKWDKFYQNSNFIKSLRMSANGWYSYAKVLNDEDIQKISNIASEKIDEAIDNIKKANFDINPKRIDNEDVGCKYCKYKDICFKKEEDIVDLENKKIEDILKEV